jgi:aldehyde:ferredoxin oxidoreductase
MKAFENGPLAGVEITEESFHRSLHRYYELMGWDTQTGSPQSKRIDQLDLSSLLNNIPLQSKRTDV